MKPYGNTLRVFALVLLGGALLSASAMAQIEPRHSPYFSDEKLASFETNLVIALESGYPGLESSAARTLRELKTYNSRYSYSRSVIPLMRIVKSERADTQSRLCAALALHDLKSTLGDYAIAITAKFTDNARVQKVCYWLAYTRELEKAELAVNAVQQAVLMAVVY
jgi:hypothetical protein